MPSVTATRRVPEFGTPFPAIEPFRVKAIEPIRRTTREERESALARAHLNLFQIDAEDVLTDLLTNSGAGAMSAAQWGALLPGDESYAGSSSFRRFQSAVREIFGIIERGLVKDGRLLRSRVHLPDYPGALHLLTGVLAELRTNIVATSYDRA